MTPSTYVILAVFVLRVVVALSDSGKGPSVSTRTLREPPESWTAATASRSAVQWRLLILLVAIVAALLADESLPWRMGWVVLAAVAMRPQWVAEGLVRLGAAGAVRFFVRIFPPRWAAPELDAARVFFEARARHVRGSVAPEDRARMRSTLDGCLHAGPTWLAADGMLHALDGDLDACHAAFEDVLTLCARPRTRRGVFMSGRVGAPLRRFVARELAFHALARLDVPRLRRLARAAHAAPLEFARAVALRTTGHPDMPSRLRLVVDYVRCPGRLSTFALLRHAWHPAAPAETPPDAVRTPVDFLSAVEALGVDRVEFAASNRARALAAALETTVSDDAVTTWLRSRGGAGLAPHALDRLVADVHDRMRDRLAQVYRDEWLRVDGAATAFEWDLAETRIAEWTRVLDDALAEYEACATDAAVPRYARAVRAHRTAVEAYDRIVAIDRSARGRVFESHLIRLWNRSVVVGDREDNWLLAYAAFSFLYDECIELQDPKSDARSIVGPAELQGRARDLLANMGLFA